MVGRPLGKQQHIKSCALDVAMPDLKSGFILVCLQLRFITSLPIVSSARQHIVSEEFGPEP